MQMPSSQGTSVTFFFITDQRSVDRTRSLPAPRPSASLPVKFVYRAKAAR